MHLKVLSLFSGAGGLDYGFKLAGFEIIGSAEIMKEAVSTHNYNFSLRSKPIDLTNPKQYKDFVEKFKKEKVDVLIGGFPCQGYSLAGKRNPNDERNQLYKIVVKVLKDLKIKRFVLENVPGILSMRKGKEIEEIKNYFQEHSLYFEYEVLDSSNFNVPQKRKRVVFIGTNSKKYLPKIKRIFNSLKNTKNPIITSREVLFDLQDKKEDINFSHILTKHTAKIRNKIQNLKVNNSLYKNFSDGWRRISYDSPSPTVKENHGGVHIHPVKNRVLTPRELARLQSFPDKFIFKGSKKMQLVQIGNAVPVNFAKIIAEKVLELF